MKAWEMEKKLYTSAKPILRTEDEQTWTENDEVSVFYDQNLMLDWSSRVPGSGAPESIMMAAVQALENRGYLVSERGYELLREGLAACEGKDHVKLQMISAQLRRELANAQKDETAEYWNYHYYHSFEEYEANAVFPDPVEVDVHSDRFRSQIRAGWISQLIGGAMGTMVEGYTCENLYKTYGEVYDYLREPNTYNDDNTFELAFLDAFERKGYAVTSEDIALSWVGFIPCGWSAEELAIRNIRNGIFPPESGTWRNPFNEWIGAQMRAGICGMVSPGDARMAAALAWRDGAVSHANNGILGEVFNAVMTSMAFVEQDIRRIIRIAADAIPKDSEYASVIAFALDCCGRYSDWRDALRDCSEKYERYNWIHAYPNACNEIIALWYGKGDFTETLHIITMCGVDVDCNAGMIMPILAISRGLESVPERYLHPAFGELVTYMRGRYHQISMDELTEATVIAVQRARCAP